MKGELLNCLSNALIGVIVLFCIVIVGVFSFNFISHNLKRIEIEK